MYIERQFLGKCCIVDLLSETTARFDRKNAISGVKQAGPNQNNVERTLRLEFPAATLVAILAIFAVQFSCKKILLF